MTTVKLHPGTTKNEQARLIFMTPELRQVMEALYASRRLDCPYVFNRNGSRIKSFRKAWDTACKRTGLAGKLFHDFRRTAVRNLTRAGVPERVAMAISGHKTRSVFDRYNIVSEADLEDAARRVADQQEKLSRTGKIVPLK